MKERMRQWQRILMPAGLAAFLIFPVACATATGANGSGVNSGTTNANGTSVSGTDISGAAAPANGSGSSSSSTSATGSTATYGGTTATTSGTTATSSTYDTSSGSTSGTSFAGTTASGTTSSGTTSSGTTSSVDTTTSSGMTSSSTNDSVNPNGWRTGGFYGSRGTAGSGGHMWGLTVSGVRGQFDNGNSSGNIGGNAGRLDSDFGNTTGFGLAATGFFSRMLALDLGASYLRPRVNYTPSTAGIGTIGGGRLRMIPLTALLQFHFLPGSFVDPYIGGGGAYLLMRNKTNLDTNAAGVRSVSYDNRFGGAVQGGLMFGFGSVGLNLDAKYLPLKVRSDARLATGPGTTIVSTRGETKINPWLFSVGLSFGF